ncbi:hypothetical protein [Alkalihalobacterium alkalinitrilicum]|uniref:hypothetical protein n=1 Tax=Alkalihalobacterium alkalinitrilicum TaxID=427920 RepID=UPI001302FA59|nr:hypothetical protein [Alkalihalobacterium alkalinitrilicum]
MNNKSKEITIKINRKKERNGTRKRKRKALNEKIEHDITEEEMRANRKDRV